MCLIVVLLIVCVLFFFFKQKTAYEMRISDWSSDVCSSDLILSAPVVAGGRVSAMDAESRVTAVDAANGERVWSRDLRPENGDGGVGGGIALVGDGAYVARGAGRVAGLAAWKVTPVWPRCTPKPIREGQAGLNGGVDAVTEANRPA